jgi:hypothetical protein
MDSRAGYFNNQPGPRMMVQPNLRGSRSIADDEEENTAKRKFIGKRRKKKASQEAKGLAKKLQF